MAPDVPTLEETRDEHAVRRARNYRRVGLVAVSFVVLAGLVGLLGIRTATATASGDGYLLTVRHAQVTRAGLAVPMHVRVTHPGGFSGPITIAISSQLLERFDFQNFYPNPSKETASANFLFYEFDPPPGEVFQLNVDARTSPDQNGSADRYQVRLMEGSLPVATVDFRMWVTP